MTRLRSSLGLVLCFGLALPLTTALPACGGSQSRSVGSTQEVPKLPPVDPKALRAFDAGLRALKLGGPESYEKAAKRFRAALEIDDKLWEAWHNLGVVLLKEGDDEAAIDAFDKALDLNPVHRPALAGRAEAKRIAGKEKSAAKDYRKLIKIDPNSVEAYARTASLLRLAGDYEDGLDVLREGLRVGGASTAIYVELGLIYLAQGRDELAKLVLGKAIQLNEEDPAILNALALVAMGEGDDQAAFAYFDRASALDPKYIDTRFNKANVLLDAGDYQGAQVELAAITEIAPDDMDAQVALGVAQRGMGEHAKARKTWDNVVKKASGRVRSDALFNLAVLEMDFIMDDKKAIAALDRYLQRSSSKHSKHKEAVELRKELGE